MSVKNTCIKFCGELRRRGFDENSDTTSIIPEDAMKNAANAMKWAKITQLRYLWETGYLVEFGYLEVVGDGEYRLTGADINA